MVLAVGASKAWAAPPGHGGQHLLLDLVHRLVGHTVPGGKKPAQQLQGEPVQELNQWPTPTCPHSHDFLAVQSSLWTWLL